MEFVRKLGSVALANRIKGLSDAMMNDIIRIYKEMNLDFEPRWFTVFQILSKRNAEIPITIIAEELKITHPAVIQVVNVLEEKGLVDSRPDATDQRKRLVSLSEKGKILALRISPVWLDIRSALDDFLLETEPEFLNIMERMELAMQKESVYSRIRSKLSERLDAEIKLIELDEEYLDDFRVLNLQWLNSYLEVTDYDRKILDDPIGEIIGKGGKVFLLLHKNYVAGCFALSPVGDNAAELHKFVISREYRGWGLGYKMLDKAIKISRNTGVQAIYLFTHEKLQAASALYKKYGFREREPLPGFNDPTGRCSVFMEYLP